MKKNLTRQYEAYLNSSNRTLRDAYTSYSMAKAKAYEICLRKCVDMKGEDFRIISANTYTFTCGWTYADSETGVLMFNVETAANSYQDEVR